LLVREEDNGTTGVTISHSIGKKKERCTAYSQAKMRKVKRAGREEKKGWGLTCPNHLVKKQKKNQWVSSFKKIRGSNAAEGKEEKTNNLTLG